MRAEELEHGPLAIRPHARAYARDRRQSAHLHPPAPGVRATRVRHTDGSGEAAGLTRASCCVPRCACLRAAPVFIESQRQLYHGVLKEWEHWTQFRYNAFGANRD